MYDWKLAVLLILKFQDKFLLIKRNNPPNQGRFVPVGGKIEKQELPEDAVIRECMEETNLQIKKPKLVGHLFENSPSTHQWFSFFYFAEVHDISGIKSSSEGALFWYKKEELLGLNIPELLPEIISAYDERKFFNLHVSYDNEMALIERKIELIGYFEFA
jgi:8-oxo-dGTP diphosphatase